MRNLMLILAYLACAGHGRRVHLSVQKMQGGAAEESQDIDNSLPEDEAAESQDATADSSEDEDFQKEEEEQRQKIQEENESQINRVRQNIDDRAAAIAELATAASDFSEAEVPSEVTALQEALASVVKSHKEAYILEEKNSKDKRALDKLEALSDEHAQARKEALADLEPLADKVKSAKRLLAKAKGKLEAKARVEQVRQNIDDRAAPIDELARRASDFNLDEFPVQATELAHLKEGLGTVQKARKEAMDLEKFLARDQRALAKKSGLTDEDKKNCKQMAKDIGTLADKVEDAKSRLTTLQKKMKAKMLIKQVKVNIENRTAAIDALASNMSALNEAELLVETTGMTEIEKAVATVAQVQQEAAKFGKLLAKDKSDLEGLSDGVDLPRDDSVTCEETIKGVEALAASVDSLKSSLSELLQQFKAKIQIKKILQNIDDREAPVAELLRTTSELSEGAVPIKMADLEEALAAVEAAQKDALYLGEFIVKDMIAVDKLAGLSEQDRQARKQAILSMNSLGDKVDNAKSRLADLHRELAAKMKEA